VIARRRVMALAFAGCAAAPVMAAHAGTPRADRLGQVTLAGTTVLWEGDATLSEPGQVVAADRLPDGTYAPGRVVSTIGREAVVSSAAADAQGRAVIALRESIPGADGEVVRVLDLVPGGAVTGRDLERRRTAVEVGGADVAVNPRGDAVVVWERRSRRTGVSELMLARRVAGGAWTAPAALVRTPARDDRLQPSVAVDAEGRFVIAWRRDGVFGATGTVAGGVAATRRLGSGGEVSGVAVAAAGDRAVVVWARATRRGDVPVAVLRRGAGALGVPRTLDAPRARWAVTRVAVAAGPEGTLAASWTVTSATPRRLAHRAALAAPGRRFAAAQALTPFGAPPAGPSPFGAAVGPDGTASVVWRREGRVEVVFATPGAPFGPPLVLGSSGAGGTGDITGLERGALVAWDRGGTVRISAASAPPV